MKNWNSVTKNPMILATFTFTKKHLHLIFFTSLNFLDYVSTKMCLSMGGIEVMPVASYVLSIAGFTGIIWLKIISVLIVAYFTLIDRFSLWCLQVLNIILIIVVLNNLTSWYILKYVLVY